MSVSRIHIAGILAAALVAFAVASCQKPDNPGPTVPASITAKHSSVEAAASNVIVQITASGAWSVKADFPDGIAAWGEVTPVSGTDNGIVHFIYQENTEKTERTVTITVIPASGSPASCQITQLGKGQDVPPIGGKYGYDVVPSDCDWLELPATIAGDGREVLVHSMNNTKYKSRSNDGVRNWSCYWDYDEHVSVWVAYPHNNGLKGSGSGRTNQWGYDPVLPTTIQPNVTNTYGGGWTRGHQIPSADRMNYMANVSTFVSTNMTPQDYDFNSGIWAALEGKVRSYCSSADTLYVVTGCCIENSTRTSGTNTGFAVKVPTHYFKALLYRGSSSYATNGYMAAGFYLPHDSGISDGNYMDYILTIDELEQKTGIDFFPNLAKDKYLGAEKAAQIESTLSQWWSR